MTQQPIPLLLPTIPLTHRRMNPLTKRRHPRRRRLNPTRTPVIRHRLIESLMIQMLVPTPNPGLQQPRDQRLTPTMRPDLRLAHDPPCLVQPTIGQRELSSFERQQKQRTPPHTSLNSSV